ncbi:hypothetical protein KIPB_010754, partial [Kipferlia bialata]
CPSRPVLCPSANCSEEVEAKGLADHMLQRMERERREGGGGGGGSDTPHCTALLALLLTSDGEGMGAARMPWSEECTEGQTDGAYPVSQGQRSEIDEILAIPSDGEGGTDTDPDDTDAYEAKGGDVETDSAPLTLEVNDDGDDTDDATSHMGVEDSNGDPVPFDVCLSPSPTSVLGVHMARHLKAASSTQSNTPDNGHGVSGLGAFKRERVGKVMEGLRDRAGGVVGEGLLDTIEECVEVPVPDPAVTDTDTKGDTATDTPPSDDAIPCQPPIPSDPMDTLSSLASLKASLQAMVSQGQDVAADLDRQRQEARNMRQTLEGMRPPGTAQYLLHHEQGRLLDRGVAYTPMAWEGDGEEEEDGESEVRLFSTRSDILADPSATESLSLSQIGLMVSERELSIDQPALLRVPTETRLEGQ